MYCFMPASRYLGVEISSTESKNLFLSLLETHLSHIITPCFNGYDINRNPSISVEISVRGQITLHNRARLKAFAYRCCDDAKGATKLLLKNGSKAALLTSFSLFAAHKDPTWISPPPLIAY